MFVFRSFLAPELDSSEQTASGCDVKIDFKTFVREIFDAKAKLELCLRSDKLVVAVCDTFGIDLPQELAQLGKLSF